MDVIQRCGQCILPSTYPNIVFDANGICNFCRAAAENEPKFQKKSKADLDAIVQGYKNKSNKYDVIVPLSGGKDSTYVAYYLKKTYDLKILGVNYDIGYRSQLAVQNLETVSDKLDIDLLTIRPNKRFLNRLFAHFLKTRGEFCSVCNNLGYLIMASFALHQKQVLGYAPLVVGGWSKQYEFQQGISVTSMQYFFENLTPQLLEELKCQPFIEEKVIAGYRQLKDPRQVLLGTEAHNRLGSKAIAGIQLPDYIPWNIRQIPVILTEALDWKHPADVHESHFDCRLFPIKEYLKFRKYGLTQETIKNSTLIREQLMTREEALERMSQEQTTEPEVMEIFFRQLGLSKSQVNWEGEWSR